MPISDCSPRCAWAVDLQTGQSLPGELQAAVPGVAGHRASAGHLEQTAATMPLLPAPGRAGSPLPLEQRCQGQPPRTSCRVGGWSLPALRTAVMPPTISGPADTSVRMLRTASPSPAGAGVRCLYQGGSLLEGWQERSWSLPFHTATGKWELAFPYPKIPQASSTGRARALTRPSTFLHRQGAGSIQLVLPACGEAPVLCQVC